MCSGSSSTISINSGILCSISFFGSLRNLSGSDILSFIFILGLSEDSGSWKIICILNLILRSSSLFNANRSTPSNNTFPPVGFINLKINLLTVVFPHPLSPTSPSVSPFFIINDTPSTALTYRLCITPDE